MVVSIFNPNMSETRLSDGLFPKARSSFLKFSCQMRVFSNAAASEVKVEKKKRKKKMTHPFENWSHKVILDRIFERGSYVEMCFEVLKQRNSCSLSPSVDFNGAF